MESFDYEVLIECSSRNEAYEREKEHIRESNSITPNGYNITPGGAGTGVGEDSNRAILTETQAKFIIANPRDCVSVANGLQISRFTVGDIRNGKSWEHLDRSNAPTYDKPYAAKLNKRQAQDIINDIRTAKELSDIYNVSVTTIRNIRIGKYYKELDRSRIPDYIKVVRKLTQNQVKIIIHDTRPHAVLAREYDISTSHIRDIRIGRIFKNVSRVSAPTYRDGRKSTKHATI